jgi:hypothetical protein
MSYRVIWSGAPPASSGNFTAREKWVPRLKSEMAVRLGKFCGNGPGLWLRLQQTYDLWHAERLPARTIDRIPTHRTAA